VLRIVSIAAAVLIGAAAFAYAGDQGDFDQGCDGSTYEMVECLRAKQREQLRVAQRLWIQYRDANCLYCGLDEGTIARVGSGDCMLRMTQSRAIELVGKEDCS
jgi:Lysozyme inhibitor LprI